MRRSGADEPTTSQILRYALRDLEGQAHALHSAYEHIAELERNSAELTVQRMGFGQLAADASYLSPIPRQTKKANWAAERQTRAHIEALGAYPGHGSASIQAYPHATVGYIIEGKNVANIESFVRSVYWGQKGRKAFSPVFITSCDAFHPFISNNYVFEYIPPRECFAASPEDYNAWKQQRLDQIKAKWALSQLIVYNSDVSHHDTHRSDRKTSIVVFPDYGPGNPYIGMMYSQIQDDFSIVFGDVQKAIDLARSGSVVFHLHWEDAVIRTLRHDAMPVAMADFVAAIDRLKSLGGGFCWTVHNVEPHDVGEGELSLEFSRQLFARADVVHVHTQEASRLVRHMYGSGKTPVVIEHPSYKGCYPEKSDKRLARQSLGLDVGEDELLFLCLGQVRRYKGIATLLNVAPEFRGRAKFVIAGRSGRYDPRGAPPDNCIIIDGHVGDQTLAELHSSADFAILPFEQMTVSGSLMLAMSFGTPVIAPSLEGVRDVVRDTCEGFLYSPDSRALSGAIQRALDTPHWRREAMEHAAYAASAFRPPEAFSAAIRDMFLNFSTLAGSASNPTVPAGQTTPDTKQRKDGRSAATPSPFVEERVILGGPRRKPSNLAKNVNEGS